MTPPEALRPSPARVCLLFAATLLALAWTGLDSRLSPIESFSALVAAPQGNAAMALMHFGWWPRVCVALLAGAGLALAGVLMQQVLRNPLAAPTTLGVATGANLALALATLLAPGLLAAGREWVALTGGGVAMGLVFMLAWRHRLSPIVVVLAGLVVNLYFGAIGTLLLLFNPETLSGLLIWGAGSLTQTGWDSVAFLWPRLLIAGLMATLLLKPLAILELDDANAQSLGVSLKQLRLISLGLAVFITACVVSAVGVIGFIGLVAPAIVRLLGARRLGQRLLWSTLFGALLLTTTDLLLQHLDSFVPMLIPTGAVTAALGAPLLLWLIPRLRVTADGPDRDTHIGQRHAAPGRLLLGLVTTLAVATALALLVGQSLHGWGWAVEWTTLQWRLPRVVAAGSAGVMLALAGTLLQRITGNPMASPEVLGISAGTSIGLIGAIFLLPSAGQLTLISVGTLSALVTLALLVLLNRSNGFAPERVLLTGVAITALFDAVRSFVLAGGDPRGNQVIAWMSGSTYTIDLPMAVTVALAAIVFALACWPFTRWLDMLPLGAPMSRALGIDVTRSRLALFGLAALLTACATLIIGPLSFVGLLAPHMARLVGFNATRTHLPGAALIGALLMILADWIGRQLMFPQDIPAGLVASLLGGAYFMWGLRRF